MKQTILIAIVILGCFCETNAQNKNRIYKKEYRAAVKPFTIPLKEAPNAVLVKNDTIVFPRDGKSVFLVYKLYYNTSASTQYRKGILVMGSGNDAQNPSVGNIKDSAGNELCKKSVQNGYVAAVLQYTAGPGTSNWNASAQQMAEDYDACISAISTKFNIPKSKSVVGGVSYAGFMLLTANAYFNILSYCKGVLASCSGTSTNAASQFKIPVYNICCAGNYEVSYGNVTGSTLYNAIHAAVKGKSECVIDNGCNTHCGSVWTNELFNKMDYWLK